MTKTSTIRPCPFGFSCRDMMQAHSDMSANDCANVRACYSLSQTSGMRDDYGNPNARYPITMDNSVWYLTRRQAAGVMLQRRGHSLNIEDDFEIFDRLTTMSTAIDAIQQQLESRPSAEYVAPHEASIHTYVVKRPSRPELIRQGIITENTPIEVVWRCQRHYQYYLLSSKQAIFEPSIGSETVKVIHLSKEDDERYRQARLGVDRRNLLEQVETSLNNITNELVRLNELINRDYPV